MDAFSFQFLSAGTIIACLMVSQAYLTTATGKLQQLSNIKEIDKVVNSRYYKWTISLLLLITVAHIPTSGQSGKYNQYLNFDVYFVTPILADTSENIYEIPKYWYGVKYHEQISNKISGEEKEKKYQAFYDELHPKNE